MVQQLLQALHALPDWNASRGAAQERAGRRLPGAAQINRSH